MTRFSIPVYTYDTIVIGSGCAGLNCVDSLYDLGHCNVALITEGMNRGTSRNTGSDKQTYYKLAVEYGQTDSVDALTATLFAGQGVNGDTALAEAAGSIRSFMKLVQLGVPFPTNPYGEFVGYQTDHDTARRATSAGPLTSKYMTEALERSVRSKNIPIHDCTLIIKLLVKEGRILGALGIDKQQTGEESRGFSVFLASNVVLATGGPAGIYQNSVYPQSQHGMTSLALEAGAVMSNLNQWQYGLASVDFRWNLSGTYQQVIPRYISVDREGKEYEFLLDYFHDPRDSVNMVFRKGYQWPFDTAKTDGSSMIDLMVYHQQMVLGRQVYLDYTQEPAPLRSGFEALSEEAYTYLKNSDALCKTPIARLEQMNHRAIELYRRHGIDLYRDRLKITVAAQHNNGGVAVDANWQTNVQGLYCVGEAAGTFGVYRPGGSALNATQVGAYRVAEHIAAKEQNTPILPDEALMEELQELACTFPAGGESKLPKELSALSERMANRMSGVGAHLRDSGGLQALQEELTDGIALLDKAVSSLHAGQLPAWYQLKDQLLTQQAVVQSMLFSGEHQGSHGGALYCGAAPDLSGQDRIAALKPAPCVIDQILCYQKEKGCWFAPVRPIPEISRWFEQVWQEYTQRTKK